jgi:hypothetical protein
MSPSHELLIRTEPSEEAFLPTRIVEHAKAFRDVQVSNTISPIRAMNLLALLSMAFMTILLSELTDWSQYVFHI